MSAAKRTKKRAAGPPGSWAAWLFGRGRPLMASLLVIAAGFAAWWWVWQRVGPRVTRAERYLVGLDRLQTTPQPEWIHTDVRSEVYQSLQFGGPMNLLDDELSPRIAEAFARHPWVERVVRVTKLAGAGVRVELEYRRPVCVVRVDGRLLPVDRRGILLPAEATPREKLERYPQLAGVDSPPLAVPGEPWGTVRVAGGAAIAYELVDVWEGWHLARIVPFPFVAPDGREQMQYSLFSEAGTRIVWGLPPGVTSPTEPTAQEKRARLKAYRARHGTFDGPAGPLDLDVRTMPDPAP